MRPVPRKAGIRYPLP